MTRVASAMTAVAKLTVLQSYFLIVEIILVTEIVRSSQYRELGELSEFSEASAWIDVRE